VLGNGLTPSTADVAVYADLHSSVPGLGKAKTAMMLRSRFLGKLPKPGYCKKWITSVDCLMNVGEDTIFQHSLLVLMDFINKNLPLHRAPVIESLCLSLWESRVKKLNLTISECGLRLLYIPIYVSWTFLILRLRENMVPNSLFTCKTLVILKP
ncbi:LOW QUALITY PROTEIN: hypothetical protein HID58_087316, partial [Brassica napus]